MVIVIYSELFGRENIPKVRKFHFRQVCTLISSATRGIIVLSRAEGNVRIFAKMDRHD